MTPCSMVISYQPPRKLGVAAPGIRQEWLRLSNWFTQPAAGSCKDSLPT